MMNTPFRHYHGAHCESSVISNLLFHYGVNISEAMAFGLSCGLHFTFIPFVRIGGIPLTAYRVLPRKIIRRLTRWLKIKMVYRTYRSPEEARVDLDALLDQGKIVGLQTSVFWLPYFPDHFRFHFNGHNIIVYGREGDEYLISDPILESPVRCPVDGLDKARFARGAFAPRGFLYYPANIPEGVDLSAQIPVSITRQARQMLRRQGPVAGIKGMHQMAKFVEKLPVRARSSRQARLDIGSIIRMQEEIGTGGGGFRFIFGSYLQETAAITGNSQLREAAELMTHAGDKLREFALIGARICKGKQENGYTEAAGYIREAADLEEQAFRIMKAAKFSEKT